MKDNNKKEVTCPKCFALTPAPKIGPADASQPVRCQNCRREFNAHYDYKAEFSRVTVPR